MTTILSIIAIFISAVSLWVSYSNYQNTKETRFNEKLLELRMRIASLRTLAFTTKDGFKLISKMFPNDISEEAVHKYDGICKKADGLHEMLFRRVVDLNKWDIKNLDDQLVILEEMEGTIENDRQYIDKTLNKISSK